MIRLPEKFIQRMSQTLSGDLEDFLASYDKPPVRGVRANLLKTSPEELKSLLAYKIERSVIYNTEELILWIIERFGVSRIKKVEGI